MLVSADLYKKICEQSRKRELFTRFQIPDTPQGRLEMLNVHLFMILYVLKAKPEPQAQEISQNLVNFFVVDMDQTLREMFISDKKMMKSFKYAVQGFYGRLYSYDAAIRCCGETLRKTFAKNIYQSLVNEDAEVLYLLSDYIYDQIDILERSPVISMGFSQGEGPVHGTIRSRI